MFSMPPSLETLIAFHRIVYMDSQPILVQSVLVARPRQTYSTIWFYHMAIDTCLKLKKCIIYRFLSGFQFFYRARLPKCKFFHSAAILAVWTLQRCAKQQWNGNFVGFSEILSKIMKKVTVKRNLHCSSKWQNRPAPIWNLALDFEAIWGYYGP